MCLFFGLAVSHLNLRLAKKPLYLAEREGFDPSVPLPVRQISNLKCDSEQRSLFWTQQDRSSSATGTFITPALYRQSDQVLPDLAKSGNFCPPCAHPTENHRGRLRRRRTPDFSDL